MNSQSKYLVLDLEVDNKEVYGRTANPWFNEVIAVGRKYFNGPYAEGDICNLDEGTVEYILQQITLLVAHNAKFDLLYLWRFKSFQDWLKSGGKIFCTQLAEYVLTGQQHRYPKLRDIAVNKYGCPERSKHIDDLLFSKERSQDYKDKYKTMQDIPIGLILEDVKNDVLDTEQVYLQQHKKAEELGMTRLLEVNMEALLALCEIEYNGLYVDQDELEKNERGLMQQLKIEEQSLVKTIGQHWR